MEKIILNGCSFIEGHWSDYTSTLSYHLTDLTGSRPINLGKAGGSNERIFRTTFNYFEAMKPQNSLVVIGLTHWARFELYDDTTDFYFPMNFFSDDFESDIKNIIGRKEYQYIDHELNLAAAEKKEFKKFFSNFTSEELRKAVLLYITVFKNYQAVLDDVLREVKLLKLLCDSTNNKLLVFNSLDCLHEPGLDYFFKVAGCHSWLDKILMDKQEHPDPVFKGHPNSESNLRVAKQILRKASSVYKDLEKDWYEIRY